MRIKCTAVVLVCLFTVVSMSFADITKDDLDAVINKNNLKHPYLYFTDDEKSVLLERIKNDPESRDIMNFCSPRQTA